MIVTAAVCTFNRYAMLADCLAALGEQSLPADQYQVLVVDNSPDRERAQSFAASYRAAANVRFVHVDRPGLSHARNVALAESSTPYLAFLDDDALAARDWLANIVETFQTAGEDVGVVGGPADPIWEAPRPPWLHDDLLGYVGVLNWGDEPLEANQRRWLIGTNVCYRRSTLAQVGGFRTDLGRRGTLLVSNEELELQARLRAAGYRAWYSPRIRVGHRIPAERLTQSWFRRRIFWQAISSTIENPPVAVSPAGEDQAALSTWLFGDTNNPRRFVKQCRRLARNVRKLSAGERLSVSPREESQAAALCGGNIDWRWGCPNRPNSVGVRCRASCSPKSWAAMPGPVR